MCDVFIVVLVRGGFWKYFSVLDVREVPCFILGKYSFFIIFRQLLCILVALVF